MKEVTSKIIDPKNPHLNLTDNNIEARPKKKGRSYHPHGNQIDLNEHSKTIRSSLEKLTTQSKEKRGLVDTKTSYFRIIFADRVNEKTILSLSMDLLKITETDRAIVGLSDSLFHDAIERLRVDNDKKNTTILKSIAILEQILPEEKFSATILDQMKNSSDEKIIETQIEFLPKLGADKYHKIINSLEEFFKQHDDRTISVMARENYGRVKVQIHTSSLKELSTLVEPIAKIDVVPHMQIDSISGEIKSTDIKPIGPQQISGSPSVCIMDTGVSKDHPLLKGLIIDSEDYSGITTDCVDNNGHGTFISGLVAYGDVFEKMGQPSPECTVCMAKILDQSKGNVDLENVLPMIVNRFKSNSRVYNLSVNQGAISVKECSFLASTIDKLEREHGVLFVISAGNVPHYQIERYLNTGTPYPNYLNNSECEICVPSEACNVITVGSHAMKESKESIAKINGPSPFTRSGGTSDGRNKPDLVEHGGNCAAVRMSNGIAVQERDDLSVKSLNYNYSKSLTCTANGTSFSAPLIARLAAKIFHRYPTASPNLIKALILNSCQNPSSQASKVISGYGRPNPRFALASGPFRATYYLESSVDMETEKVISFRVPAKMGGIPGIKRMIITLVYDPPVDYTTYYYSLIDLNFDLQKGGARDGDYQISSKDNWKFLSREKYNNVKQGIFEWSKGSYGVDWKIVISPSNRGAIKKKDIQKFALVITLEDPTEKNDIYTSIIQELKINIKDQVRVQM